MLEFQNVSLSLGNTTVLKDINFQIYPGEVVAILGESGAGKSSVFRLLIREEKPTLGVIKLDALSLGELSFDSIQKYRRQIGIVFQDFRLLPKKTVAENVAFALEVCGEEEAIAEKVPALLEFVGLEGREHHFPAQLSGGERQRVAIARALVHDPKILMADEPTGNLDPKNSAEIATLFKKLNQERDMTVLLATHDPVLIQVLSPRIIRLKNGAIQFDEKTCSTERAFAGMV